jgi:hypothetical protein
MAGDSRRKEVPGDRAVRAKGRQRLLGHPQLALATEEALAAHLHYEIEGRGSTWLGNAQPADLPVTLAKSPVGKLGNRRHRWVSLVKRRSRPWGLGLGAGRFRDP